MKTFQTMTNEELSDAFLHKNDDFFVIVHGIPKDPDRKNSPYSAFGLIENRDLCSGQTYKKSTLDLKKGFSQDGYSLQTRDEAQSHICNSVDNYHRLTICEVIVPPKGNIIAAEKEGNISILTDTITIISSYVVWESSTSTLRFTCFLKPLSLSASTSSESFVSLESDGSDGSDS